MLSTVCMGVVFLTQWLWMQPRGPPHLSSLLPHPLYLPHPLPRSSLFPLAHPLILPPQDTFSTLPLPPCPSPSATGLTPSLLPGELLPRLVRVPEDSVSLDPLLALLGPLFLPTPQFLSHHLALCPAL